jgi:hypothetical protein
VLLPFSSHTPRSIISQIAENNTSLTAQRQQGSDKPDLLHLRSEGYHIRASSMESSLKRPRGD